MTKTKVLLSVDDEELKKIDEQAQALRMSRSAYLVAMGKQGSASLYSAIENLKVELDKFATSSGRGESKRIALLALQSFGRLTRGSLQLMKSSERAAKLAADAGVQPGVPSEARGLLIEATTTIRDAMLLFATLTQNEGEALRSLEELVGAAVETEASAAASSLVTADVTKAKRESAAKRRKRTG